MFVGCIPLHVFPNPEKDRERFNTWMMAIGGDILGLENNHILKYRRVCHNHFEARYHCRNNKISNIAIPTLNLAGPLSLPQFSFSELKPLRNVDIEPSSSNGAPHTQCLYDDCLTMGDLELMDKFISEGQRNPDDRKAMENTSSADICADGERKNIAHAVSPKRIYQDHETLRFGIPDTYNENPPPKKIMKLDLSLAVEDMIVVPSSSDSQDINKYTSENHGPEAPYINQELPSESSDLPVINEEINVTLSNSNSDSFKEHSCSTHGPETQHNKTRRNKKPICRKPGKIAHKKCLLPLTTKEKSLKLKIISLQIKVSKLKNKAKKQMAELKAARSLTNNPGLQKMLESCSSTARMFFEMQWRENKKKIKGRRFTLDEKIMALSIFKQSPKAYRFFRKIFLLPAPQTLTKLVQKANIHAGINSNIFQQLKHKAAEMKTHEKLCVLLFDEVSLKPNLWYSEKKDTITGFVNDGVDIKPEYANHAQVFMVRGLLKNYKQPVAYTFSASATKGPELAKQIKNVISEVQKSGLSVVATVCDQGSNNRQAIKLLMSESRGIQLRRGERPKDNTILINDQEIVPLYDPPHLLKGIRNNLMTKDLKYVKDGVARLAKWSHLKNLYEECPGYKGIRLLPKLTENHIKPEKINKMKVKYASQLFSETVASTMGYLADKGILSPESKDTADLLLLFDHLFDSVNGSATKNKHAKPLLGPATLKSAHLKLWRESKKTLASMQFITASHKKESVPSVQNWIWTLDGMEVLIKNLNNRFGVSSVWLRHLNQDPLENFFGAIRSHGCRNVNPTCDQFESAYVSLLINNLTSVHSQGKNCEDDFGRALHTLVLDDNVEATSYRNADIGDITDIHFTPLPHKEATPSVIAPLQYVSGYILKKTKSKIFKTCAACHNDCISKDDVEYIKYREFTKKRWLFYPSHNMLLLMSNLQDITNHVLKGQLEIKYLKETIKTAMYTWIDLQWLKCETHKGAMVEYIVNLFARFMIFNHCKSINKIMTGKRDIDDDGDIFQAKAKKIYLSTRKTVK